MSKPSTQVIAIGNAIVDVMAPCSDDLIDQLGLVRGGMTLVDTQRAHDLYEAMGPAREISGGSELTIDRDRDKNPVVALREIAEETVGPRALHESLVTSLQKILPDDEDEADEIGSLSQSAEALRITASAPTRSNSMGGDFDG